MDEQQKAAIYRFHAEFCKCLANASRLMIITQLEGGEVSVGELSQLLGLPQASVSKHLAVQCQCFRINMIIKVFDIPFILI